MRVRSYDVRLVDVLVAAVGVWQQTQIWTGSSQGDRTATVPLQLAFVACLLLRSRYRVASRVGAMAALGLWAGVMPHDRGTSVSFFVGAVLAFWVAGMTTDARAAAAGWAAGIALVTYTESVFPGGGASDVAFTALLLTGLWAAALAFARRSSHAAALEADLAHERSEREARTQQAVAEERGRIARELHDVVSHNLTVAIIQLTAAQAETGGGAGRHLGAADAACRRALAEMRRLLDVLPAGGTAAALAPPPGPTSVLELVEAVRLAGLPVELSVSGALPPDLEGVDLAAYRIVQEALTNALKHGDGAPAKLTVSYERDAIAIELLSSGDPQAVVVPGRGLVGMHERAALYGGTVEAGFAEAGGFRVSARLPLEAAER